MKRLNIILISEEQPAQQQQAPADPFPVDVDAQVNILNSMLGDNPSMAEDPQFKQLLQTSEALKAEQEKAAPTQQAAPAEQKPANEQAPAVGTEQKPADKSPLSSLPFFKEDESQAVAPPTAEELKTLTPETFHEFAKKYGVDPTAEGWVGSAIEKIVASVKPAEQQTQFEQQYKELSESILALPKELQTAVNLHIEGKDWKSSLSNSTSVDLSKDFDKLSADEKIKVHNYYFPEDTLAAGEDVTKKDVSKSIKAAEAKFNADKYVANQESERVTREAKDRNKSFLSSVDISIAELKKAYPNFKEKELKAAEEVVKKGGIYNVFFDKNGNLKPEGFKKLIFAEHGEKILQVATSIAENQGRTKGKSEVLSVEQGAEKKPNGGGTELTNAEKDVQKLVSTSMVGANLTY